MTTWVVRDCHNLTNHTHKQPNNLNVCARGLCWQVFYSGRQVGGKVVHGSRVAEKTKAGAQLMPTEPELLEDARNWVEKWPDAVRSRIYTRCHPLQPSACILARRCWAWGSTAAACEQPGQGCVADGLRTPRTVVAACQPLQLRTFAVACLHPGAWGHRARFGEQERMHTPELP